jgi:NADH-quinone oxidoreductase subunit J
MTDLIPTLLFYVFSAGVLGAASMVIASRNPVHCVLFLIFAFFNAAGLFVLLGAEYLAMTLVIVYVGAVAVLFLFVVMMLNINLAEIRQRFLKHLGVGVTVAGALAFELLLVIYLSLLEPDAVATARNPMYSERDLTNTHALGQVMYTDYILAFQISGLILLVAMIGAIVLTLRSRTGVRKQNISKQLARKRADAIEVVK